LWKKFYLIKIIIVSSNPKVKHVSEILQNYPHAKDNHDLWRNFESSGFKKVIYGGIHGDHSYKPPQGGFGNRGYNHIASPHPASVGRSKSRIIASELPSPSKSGTSFDLPARKNVLQIDIPSSTTQTTTYSYNASTQKEPNMKLQFHGIEPVKPTFHGKFIELKSEVKESKPSKKVFKKVENDLDFNKAKEDTLKTAKKVENIATTLLSQVHAAPSQMSVPIHVSNKKETNNLRFDKKHI